MVLAASIQSLLKKPKTTICVLSTASALLLSACSSTSDVSGKDTEAMSKTPVAASTSVAIAKETNSAAASSSANAAKAQSNDDAMSRGSSWTRYNAKPNYAAMPLNEGTSWSQDNEDAYLKALQQTDLVFDENSKQLIHVKDATPLRTIIYQQNGIPPLKRNDDAQKASPAGDEPAAKSNNTLAAPEATNSTSSNPITVYDRASESDTNEQSMSLVEVAALASAQSKLASQNSELDKPITPVTKPVRVSSIRDTQNHWQKSTTPCRNCSNYYDYDPVYYEPFYQKFPTPGVDKK